MEIFTFDSFIFYLLAAAIVVFSILTVTTKRILRAATYLLFVLFATAGLYFRLNYSFLGAVQLTVYAGGIIILYVFSILLTSPEGDHAAPLRTSKFIAGLASALIGLGVVLFIIMNHQFASGTLMLGEIDMRVLGTALMGTSKYQYLLPFEAISVLLLACIVGGITIARKR